LTTRKKENTRRLGSFWCKGIARVITRRIKGDCGCTKSRGSQMYCYQFKESKARVKLEIGEN